jgi:hypothetical protein
VGRAAAAITRWNMPKGIAVDGAVDQINKPLDLVMNVNGRAKVLATAIGVELSDVQRQIRILVGFDNMQAGNGCSAYDTAAICRSMECTLILVRCHVAMRMRLRLFLATRQMG